MVTKRDLTAALLTEVTSSIVSPILLTDLSFPSASLRLWSGYGDLTFDGDVYTGSGEYGGISPIEETAKTKAAGVNLTLTGIPLSIISLALTEDYQGREAKVYLGALDSSGVLVVDPFLVFQGYMDTMDMTESGETANFSLAVENKLIALERPNRHLWTSARQKLDYPTDKGFDLVTELQDKEVKWK